MTTPINPPAVKIIAISVGVKSNLYVKNKEREDWKLAIPKVKMKTTRSSTKYEDLNDVFISFSILPLPSAVFVLSMTGFVAGSISMDKKDAIIAAVPAI